MHPCPWSLCKIYLQKNAEVPQVRFIVLAGGVVILAISMVGFNVLSSIQFEQLSHANHLSHQVKQGLALLVSHGVRPLSDLQSASLVKICGQVYIFVYKYVMLSSLVLSLLAVASFMRLKRVNEHGNRTKV